MIVRQTLELDGDELVPEVWQPFVVLAKAYRGNDGPRLCALHPWADAVISVKKGAAEFLDSQAAGYRCSIVIRQPQLSAFVHPMMPTGEAQLGGRARWLQKMQDARRRPIRRKPRVG